jgi:CheY-like chemotaxis protein
MTTVLVVDDSPSDRRLVGKVLKDDGDLIVEYAVDGAEALNEPGNSVTLIKHSDPNAGPSQSEDC